MGGAEAFVDEVVGAETFVDEATVFIDEAVGAGMFVDEAVGVETFVDETTGATGIDVIGATGTELDAPFVDEAGGSIMGATALFLIGAALV